MADRSEKLFELIQSLSKTEKSYFNKFSKLHSSSDDFAYMKIYAEIARMKIYDESRLVKKFGKKNLSYNKSYLYKQILAALRVLNHDKSNYLKTLNSMIDVNILMRKGLFNQAHAIIDKNIISTQEKNYHFLTLKFIDIKFQLLKIRNQKLDYLKLVQNLKLQYQNSVSIIRKKLKLSYYVSSFVYLLEKSYNPKQKELLNIFDEFVEEEDFKESDERLTRDNENDRLILYSIVYDRKKDYKNALKFGILQHESYLEYAEKKGSTIKEDTHSLVNVVMSAILANDEDCVNKYLSDLLQLKDKFPKETEQEKSYIDLNFIAHNYFHFARNKKYESNVGVYEKLWVEFKEIEDLAQDYFLYPSVYMYAYLFEFKGGNFDKSLELLNTYFTVSKDKNRSLINPYEELFRIICLYETEQVDVAMDYLKAYTRKKAKEKNPFGDLIVKAVRAKLNRKDYVVTMNKLDAMQAEIFDIYEMRLYNWLK